MRERVEQRSGFRNEGHKRRRNAARRRLEEKKMSDRAVRPLLSCLVTGSQAVCAGFVLITYTASRSGKKPVFCLCCCRPEAPSFSAAAVAVVAGLLASRAAVLLRPAGSQLLPVSSLCAVAGCSTSIGQCFACRCPRFLSSHPTPPLLSSTVSARSTTCGSGLLPVSSVSRLILWWF